MIGPSSRMQVNNPNDNPGTTPDLVRIAGDVVLDSKDQPKFNLQQMTELSWTRHFWSRR